MRTGPPYDSQSKGSARRRSPMVVIPSRPRRSTSGFWMRSASALTDELTEVATSLIDTAHPHYWRCVQRPNSRFTLLEPPWNRRLRAIRRTTHLPRLPPPPPPPPPPPL